MISDLANKIYFRYWNEPYLKDVDDIKKASIICLELIKSESIFNTKESEDIDVAIEEINNLYK